MSLQRNAGAVRRYARMMRFGNWLQALPGRLTPPPFRLMQIGSAFWQSRALYVAARLDIATQIGDATLDAATIAARVGADPDATERLLRLLTAIGVFELAAGTAFANNRVSACLRTDNPRNVRAMILMHNSDVMARPWLERLEQGVREGVPPFALTHGEPLYTYMDGHPEFEALFAQAMDSVEALAGDGFATDFDWGRFARIIDVGGSRGAKSLTILRHHPTLQALVLDRAQVIAQARQYWAAHPANGLERMQFATADLMESLPQARERGDVFLLSGILHGFDDDSCVLALNNLVRACAGSDARIALLEIVRPAPGADIATASFDMQMFMGTRGRERSLDQWHALFARCGVALEQVVGLRSFASVLVLRPK